MSKIAKAIIEVDQGERYMVQKPFNFVDIKAEWSTDIVNFRKLYFIGAQVGAKAIVDDITNDGAALSQAIKDTKLAVVEEIFGEFRAPLSRLRMALYDRDTSKAQQILADLEKQMFYEGIYE